MFGINNLRIALSNEIFELKKRVWELEHPATYEIGETDIYDRVILGTLIVVPDYNPNELTRRYLVYTTRKEKEWVNECSMPNKIKKSKKK